jgi:hypothetical protein
MKIQKYSKYLTPISEYYLRKMIWIDTIDSLEISPRITFPESVEFVINSIGSSLSYLTINTINAWRPRNEILEGKKSQKY